MTSTRSTASNRASIGTVVTAFFIISLDRQELPKLPACTYPSGFGRQTARDLGCFCSESSELGHLCLIAFGVVPADIAVRFRGIQKRGLDINSMFIQAVSVSHTFAVNLTR